MHLKGARASTVPSDKHLQSLTALRGVAALAVVMRHFTFSIFGAADGPGFYLIPLRGYLAVDLFFILSGFVLAHVYGEEFAAHVETGRFGRFLWARIARIYPLHLLALLMLVGSYGHSPAYSQSALFANLLLLQGPWLSYATWNDPSWSISAEWHAYILFPFLCTYIWRRGIGARVALGAVCWIALALMTASQDGDFQPITHGAISLARSLPEFLIGMLIYRLYRSGWWVRRWRSDWSFMALAALIVALTPLWPTDLAIVTLLPLLLLATVSNQGFIHRVLNGRALVALGNMSYALYMVHLICLDGVERLARIAHPTAVDYPEQFLLFVGALLAALLMSSLLYRCFERPARFYLRELWRRRDMSAQPARPSLDT